MRILATVVWMFIFSIFFAGDTIESQPVKLPEPEIHIYSNSEMQILELSSRIKLSYCQLLIIRNQMAIEECKNIRINLENYRDDEIGFTEKNRNK